MSGLKASFKIGLPPLETVEFFRAKARRPLIDRWWETWEEEHTRAFTVTGIKDMSVMNAVYDSLDKVVSQGGTFEMWKSDILGPLQTAVDAGTAPENILTTARLRTIYGTNLRMSRAAGQWKRIQELKEFQPFLVYWAIKDGRTRPLHRQWGGLDTGTKPIVLPVDHPAWAFYYPPNGWGCRCNVIQMSQSELATQGWSVTTEAELAAIGWPTRDDPQGTDRFDWVRGDGAIESVPRGIDPGFAYNIGQSHLRGLAESLKMTLAKTAEKNTPLAQEFLRQIVAETAFDAVLKQPGNIFPVMIVNKAEQQLLGSQTPVAVMSSETWAKQLATHADLTMAEYRQLVELGAAPQIILRQANEKIILMRLDDGRWLKATVKVTGDGKELFVVNYQFARAKEVARLTRLNEVIRDVRE